MWSLAKITMDCTAKGGELDVDLVDLESLAVLPQICHVTSLSLMFLICETNITDP